MSRFGVFVARLVFVLVAAAAGLTGWLWLSPPELIRVGAAYSAKIVCSNVFLAGRDPREVLAVDVQAPGHPLLRLMRVDVDPDAGRVDAGLLGLFGVETAVGGLKDGCTSWSDRSEPAPVVAPPEAKPTAGQGLWPEGNQVEPSESTALAAVLDDPGLAGPGWRAIVVVKDGRIAGERYAEGFTTETPLLGWSMTKSVTAGIIATLVKEGRMDVQRAALFPEWAGDERRAIKVADLLAMSSGLAFNEDYGDVTDVTRMLFLEPDMAHFALDKPLAAEPGTTFSYSSGTTEILSWLWQDAAGAEAAGWPREKLFGPLGMESAVLERDQAGTFVGSSYLYATARDWARYGQFLLQDGVWDGQAILPPGFAAWMREPAPASGGRYGRGHVWLEGPTAGDENESQPDQPRAVPPDTFWMEGHDGQSVAIIPSKRMVVVRMGLTPSKLRYQPQALVAAAAAALE